MLFLEVIGPSGNLSTLLLLHSGKTPIEECPGGGAMVTEADSRKQDGDGTRLLTE